MPEFEFVSGPPEEIFQKMKEMHDNHVDYENMEREHFYHTLEDFMQRLSDDDLLFFSALFRNLISSEMAMIQMSQFSVSASRIYTTRRNLCAICHKNHDEEAAKAFAAPEAPTQDVAPESVTNVFGVDPANPNAIREIQAEEFGCAVSDQPGDMRVQCMNCKQMYPSLEDRMLAPAGKEGCPGCRQKEKWG